MTKSIQLIIALIIIFATQTVNAGNIRGLSFDVTETSITWGGTIQLSFTLSCIETLNSTSTGIYLSTDANIGDSGDYLLTQVTIPAYPGQIAAPGLANAVINLPSSNPFSTQPTVLYVGMVQDIYNQETEWDESDNKNRGQGIDRDGTISINYRDPDLLGYRDDNQGYRFNVSETAVEWGESLTVQYYVANLGDLESGTFKVSFYLSEDQEFSASNDYRLSTITFPTLEGFRLNGESGRELFLPSFNPLNGSPSQLYVGMVIDSDNEVSESNESNNSGQGQFTDWDGLISITYPDPDILVNDSVSPFNDLSIDFGDVVNDGIGNSRGVETVRLSNNGGATLNISEVSLSGASAFSIVDGVSSLANTNPLNGLPDTIRDEGDENWIITLQYDPTANGAETASLTIRSDDPDEDPVTIDLSGAGLPIPDIHVTDNADVLEDLFVNFGATVNDGIAGATSVKTV